MSRRSSPIGSHVRVGGGLLRQGLREADLVGAEVIQVFVGNPRGWAVPAQRPTERPTEQAAQDAAFRAECDRRGLPVFVHAPYLVNLGSPDPDTLRRSVAALERSLRRARAIGARGVVVHTGSAVRPDGRDAALARLRTALLPLLDALPEDGPDLLLEPTAGQGRSLCATLDDLGPYLDRLDRHPRAAVCLDTCHAFAAGHDLAAPGGMRRLLDGLQRTAGRGRLRLVHANDSADVVGGHLDRHAPIGAGHIGVAPFAELLAHPATSGVPVVVETPGGPQGHARDVALLKQLRPA